LTKLTPVLTITNPHAIYPRMPFILAGIVDLKEIHVVNQLFKYSLVTPLLKKPELDKEICHSSLN